MGYIHKLLSLVWGEWLPTCSFSTISARWLKCTFVYWSPAIDLLEREKRVIKLGIVVTEVRHLLLC